MYAATKTAILKAATPKTVDAESGIEDSSSCRRKVVDVKRVRMCCGFGRREELVFVQKVDAMTRRGIYG